MEVYPECDVEFEKVIQRGSASKLLSLKDETQSLNLRILDRALDRLSFSLHGLWL